MLLTGVIKVNPKRPEDFRKQHKLNTVVLELGCRGLAPFCIDMLRREYGPWLHLAPPMFGLHVTLVKGTERFSVDAAKAYDGQTMTVQANMDTLARTNWSATNPGFWCIDIGRRDVDVLRSKLRVKTDRYGLIPHITVAREREFFMQAKKMTNAEAYHALKKAIELIPTAWAYRGSNYLLLKDLERLRCLPALVTAASVMELIAGHLPVPADHELAYPGFNTRWEHDIVQLFRKN